MLRRGEGGFSDAVASMSTRITVLGNAGIGNNLQPDNLKHSETAADSHGNMSPRGDESP